MLINPFLTGPQSMDELFMHCFLKALKTTAKKVEIPILTSNFFRLHMVKVCPDNQTLDVKKSTYKKLSKVLYVLFFQICLPRNEIEMD